MPQHTVSAMVVRMEATWPPHVRVSASELSCLRPRMAPASRHSTEMATPANATSRPIRPIVDMKRYLSA